ncbi:hypothetical protein [Paenibacillus arenosi]|uniref:DUF2975 domain-containing protein n=1 Tax=Paenibacillus arenosi TaxID=2774142 RepID=A0ABR9AY46_9BACL|nr:hypothetical protein [Paenibacillus arenosi]MBD8499008.1 hypothetical protein [Paenibacillus arenosi]
MNVFIRIASSFLSSFLISYTLAYINTVPESERVPNRYYISFSDNFIAPFIFLLLIYIVAAVLYSIVVDNKLRTIKVSAYIREMIAILLYIVGGFITVFIFFGLLTGLSYRGFEIGAILYGGAFALVYYLVTRMLQFVCIRIFKN